MSKAVPLVSDEVTLEIVIEAAAPDGASDPVPARSGSLAPVPQPWPAGTMPNRSRSQQPSRRPLEP